MIAAMTHLLAIHFNATDTHRMQEIGYLLIAVAGVLFVVGSGMPLGGRSGRSVGGLLLAIAGVLLLAAVRWGS
jgi:drug/metabolite transporter (DMT)-like permease